jgi:4-hydroxythreonine-4-phosphate dehydrogenase
MAVTTTTLPLLALTQGEPAGIGPEIIWQALAREPELLSGCLVVGDAAVLERAQAWVASQPSCAQVATWRVQVVTSLSQVNECGPGVLPVWQIGVPGVGCVPPGQITAAGGRLAADAVVWAARAALRGDVAAVVTAPIHKQALAAAGVLHPGHTELLQAEAAAHLGCKLTELPVRMMLANDELRTVLVSIHVSLRDAIEAVTHHQVVETLRISHESLSRLLGRPPHLGVAGLNPHAGEGGLMGREEQDVIEPAIRAARALGIQASGPYPPDTVFMRARHTPDHPGEFDAVVAMYHDQGLIPVKYLGVEQGVNVTLGLPLVRTSPDHGTAFDLAGTGRADPTSLLQAIRMARVLSVSRHAPLDSSATIPG